MFIGRSYEFMIVILFQWLDYKHPSFFFAEKCILAMAKPKELNVRYW